MCGYRRGSNYFFQHWKPMCEYYNFPSIQQLKCPGISTEGPCYTLLFPLQSDIYPLSLFGNFTCSMMRLCNFVIVVFAWNFFNVGLVLLFFVTFSKKRLVIARENDIKVLQCLPVQIWRLRTSIWSGFFKLWYAYHQWYASHCSVLHGHSN
jgi:hypothetical protein